MAVRIDPELERQLTTGGSRKVQAVMSFSPQAKGVRSAEDVEVAAHSIISRAKKVSGEAPSRVKVFKYMDSFVVEGSATFVRSLIAQGGDLEAAVANIQPTSIIGKSPIPSKMKPVRRVKKSTGVVNFALTSKKRPGLTAAKKSRKRALVSV